MKPIALAIAALLSLTASGAACADDIGAPKCTVKFGDLDLSHKAGEVVLYRRINQAARKVCESLDVSQSVLPKSMGDAYVVCVTKAVADAVATINNPDFTGYVWLVAAPKKHPVKLADR